MNIARTFLGWTALAMLVATQNIAAQECTNCEATPRDGFYDRTLTKNRQALEYDFVGEKDVAWEKRVWQTIDVQSKRNEHFRFEKMPLINIIREEAEKNNLSLYSVMDDEFKTRLSATEVGKMFYSEDTIASFDAETFDEMITIVRNDIDPSNIKKFRIKEAWYIDEETGRMGVRILGIAPIISRYDNDGNFLNEGPMFWAYYPELRKALAKHEAYNTENEAARLSWEDVFEARLFESTISKESNVHDRRIQDYKSGVDALVEADKIKQSMFNREQDMWEP